MTDIILESLRAIVVGLIVLALFRVRHSREIRIVDGWRPLVFGFLLVFFGTLIDITDNFTGLNRFVIIGDTPVQAFLEKVVAYLFGFVFIFWGVWRWLPKVIDRQRMITQDLEKARDTVETLEGMLPICASCKNIRDDQGYWSRIECYISDRSEVRFSHSICPSCMEKLYPEQYAQMKAEKA